MQNLNKFKLGVFVLSAIAVLIIAISFMGIFDDFKPKAHLVTYVNESVQGLSSGSRVCYKGVQVGNVNHITINLATSRIRIEMDIDLSKVYKRTSPDQRGNIEEVSQQDFYAYLQEGIKKGLACRIEPEGITGNKYIEIDYYIKTTKLAKEDAGRLQSRLHANKFYMPSVPSMFANIKVNLIEILANIASVDFKGISNQLNTMLKTVNKSLDKARLEALVVKANGVADKLEQTVTSLNKAMAENKVDKVIKDIDTTFNAVRDLSENLNQIIAKANMPATASSIRQLTHSLHNNSQTLQTSLQKANDAMDALTELLLYLSDNPTSLLHGRKDTKREKLK